MSEENNLSLDISQPLVEIEVDLDILPSDLFKFQENIQFGGSDNPAFIPREDELEFSFPGSSGTSRLVYKDLSSFD